MDFSLFFIGEAVIALFLGLLMLINNKKHQQVGSYGLFLIFLFIIIKSIAYYFYGLFDIELVEVAVDSWGSTKTVPNPDLKSFYSMKYLLFHVLETIFAISIFNYFMTHIYEAQHFSTKKIRLISVSVSALLILMMAAVMVLSYQTGKTGSYETGIFVIEFLKGGIFRFALGVVRIVFLIYTLKEIFLVFGVKARNMRHIERFKPTIIKLVSFEIAFTFFSTVLAIYQFHWLIVIQIFSIIFLAYYAFQLSEDMMIQLSEKYEKQQSERSLLVTLLQEIGTFIGSGEFDLETVENLILKNAIKSVEARSGVIYLKEENSDYFVADYINGLFPTITEIKSTNAAITDSIISEKLKNEKIKSGEGLIGEVIESGKNVFIADTAAKEVNFVQTIPQLITVTSYMAVPLKTKDGVFGVLALISDNRSFSIEELRLLETLANFNDMAFTIYNYSWHMEDLVAKRTAEVQALLEQQRGDYYLTSLLVKPLILNEVRSDKYDIKFYVQQKKKFKFRKWESEIGGDINIAHNITLRGRKYIAFTNADAMGKSLQGAGGALVFGVVYNSIITRTQNLEIAQDMTPSEWLEETYKELQDTFESFDGSMLMSGILGLIDEETGDLTFFNCEHPYLVKYRDGKAEFMEDESTMARKIGTIGFSGMDIQKTKLSSGDILFMGSDGRDDLKLGEDEETGFRIINEDETLFLQSVEKGKGTIEGVKEEILQNGELTDDFTLLRIWVKGPLTDSPAVTEESSPSVDVKKTEKEQLAIEESTAESQEETAQQPSDETPAETITAEVKKDEPGLSEPQDDKETEDIQTETIDESPEQNENESETKNTEENEQIEIIIEAPSLKKQQSEDNVDSDEESGKNEAETEDSKSETAEEDDNKENEMSKTDDADAESKEETEENLNSEESSADVQQEKQIEEEPVQEKTEKKNINFVKEFKESFQLFKSGEYQTAKDILDGIFDAANTKTEMFKLENLYGHVEYKLNHSQEALNHWQKALELKPDDKQTAKNIEVVKKKMKKSE